MYKLCILTLGAAHVLQAVAASVLAAASFAQSQLHTETLQYPCPLPVLLAVCNPNPHTLQVVAASGSTAASSVQRQLDTVQRQLRAEELQKQDLDRRLQGALTDVLELKAALKLQKGEQADLDLQLEQAQVCTGGSRGSGAMQRPPGRLVCFRDTVLLPWASRLGGSWCRHLAQLPQCHCADVRCHLAAT